jgi:hypothetical protein
MDKNEFLEKNIFTDLENINDGFDSKSICYFSESDFQIILARIEHFGIGIYGIEPWLNGEFFGVKTNEDYKKKATDPIWYKKAFSDFKKLQTNLQYSASYKVSTKLLSD